MAQFTTDLLLISATFILLRIVTAIFLSAILEERSNWMECPHHIPQALTPGVLPQ
jgi:hypothetical protein